MSSTPSNTISPNPNGGNSLTQNLNLPYLPGDIAWLLTSTPLILLMIPGTALFYSGLARRKSALSMLWLALMATSVVSVQWFLWGYSLAFSHDAGAFVGGLANVGFRGVLGRPSVGSGRVPDLGFAVFEGGFGCVSASLVVASTFERGRLLPCIIFVFLWSTLVYCPIVAWIWNPHGWLYKLGALDFAGGTVVHISSGSAALAYSYALGKRSGYGTQKLNYPPHNITHIVLGTMFLWIGSFGLNAGSALSANLRAVMAAVVTNLSASIGGITWCLLDYRIERKFTAVGFCSGVIVGLVVITPGYIPPYATPILSITAATLTNLSTQLKHRLNADDALDIFAVHALAGLLGVILTGIFAADYIAHLDGYTVIPGGWINGNWMQVPIQFAAGCSATGWSFGVSWVLLRGMAGLARWVPGLRLRVDAAGEEVGIDWVEIGESAYDDGGMRAEGDLAGVEGSDAFEMGQYGSRRVGVAGPSKGGHCVRTEISGPISEPKGDGGFS